MAWVKTNPADDALLVNFPANCRANWDAITLGTDAALLIDNAKVAAAAAIADTKLAAIATAAKVSGAALTLLPNIPGGAGDFPLATIPDTLTGKDADKLDGQHGSYYRNADQVDSKHAADLYNYGTIWYWGSAIYLSAAGSYTTELYGKVYLTGDETVLNVYCSAKNPLGNNTLYIKVKIGTILSGEMSTLSTSIVMLSTTIDVTAHGAGYYTIELQSKCTDIGYSYGGAVINPI